MSFFAHAVATDERKHPKPKPNAVIRACFWGARFGIKFAYFGFCTLSCRTRGRGRFVFSKQKEAFIANEKSKPFDKQKAIVASGEDGKYADREYLFGALIGGKSFLEYSANRNIFRQGDPADSVFYLRKGKITLVGHIPTGQGSDCRRFGGR